MRTKHCLNKTQKQELNKRFRDAQEKLPARGRTALFFSAFPEFDNKEGRALFYNMTHNKTYNKDLVIRLEILSKHIELAKARARDEYEFLGDIV